MLRTRAYVYINTNFGSQNSVTKRYLRVVSTPCGHVLWDYWIEQMVHVAISDWVRIKAVRIRSKQLYAHVCTSALMILQHEVRLHLQDNEILTSPENTWMKVTFVQRERHYIIQSISEDEPVSHMWKNSAGPMLDKSSPAYRKIANRYLVLIERKARAQISG